LLDKFLLSRMASSIEAAVDRLKINLKGMTVVTECATGIYACTPVIALLADAEKVVAFGKDSRFGSFSEAEATVSKLTTALSLDRKALQTINDPVKLEESFKDASIVTNSGHLRPLDLNKVSKMKTGCVIPLMYESWEFRPKDVSLEACRQYNIPVAGTNERHSNVGVFEYLGPVVVQALQNAGLEIVGNNILLVSDNDFGPYVKKTITGMGANVLDQTNFFDYDIDAIIFAHTPSIAGGQLDLLSLNLPNKLPICCQLWGDVDRSYFETQWLPEHEPEPGHMGLMLSSLGVEPIVRLQSGGLKVGQILFNARKQGNSVEETLSLVEKEKYGMRVD
jgi:hypothetical protein